MVDIVNDIEDVKKEVLNHNTVYDSMETSRFKETLNQLIELEDEYVENTTNLAAHSSTSHNGFGIIDGNNLLSLPSSSGYQTGESYVARIAKASGTPSGHCSYRKYIATTSGKPYTFSFKFKMISGSASQVCGHWAGGTGQAISVTDRRWVEVCIFHSDCFCFFCQCRSRFHWKCCN